MKLGLIWEWGRAKEIYPNWRDGLRAALEILGKKIKIDWYFDEAPPDNYDWILTWCDSNSNFSKFYTHYKAKRSIILTTNPSNYHNLEGFDIVFCESTPIYEECRQYGLHAVKAFGTDEKFYKPKQVEKDIEYFYPATFSPWKRQSEISHLGNKLLCVGTIQPDGQYEYQACMNAGVKCEVGYFPPEKILSYYQRAKEVIIPAVHGSERTVLEAMACNILPQVTQPIANRRTYSYIKEFEKSDLLSPREFIRKYYSANQYANTLLKSWRSYED